MSVQAVLSAGIGTSARKGVLVAHDRTLLPSPVRKHAVGRPGPGKVEMDAEVRWGAFVSLARELTWNGDVRVVAVGPRAIGPCVLNTDHDDVPLRPAILSGADARAVVQVAWLKTQFSVAQVLRRGGSALPTQAVCDRLYDSCLSVSVPRDHRRGAPARRRPAPVI